MYDYWPSGKIASVLFMPVFLAAWTAAEILDGIDQAKRERVHRKEVTGHLAAADRFLATLGVNIRPDWASVSFAVTPGGELEVLAWGEREIERRYLFTSGGYDGNQYLQKMLDRAGLSGYRPIGVLHADADPATAYWAFNASARFSHDLLRQRLAEFADLPRRYDTSWIDELEPDTRGITIRRLVDTGFGPEMTAGLETADRLALALVDGRIRWHAAAGPDAGEETAGWLLDLARTQDDFAPVALVQFDGCWPTEAIRRAQVETVDGGPVMVSAGCPVVELSGLIDSLAFNAHLRRTAET